jgi:hypothetical protein
MRRAMVVVMVLLGSEASADKKIQDLIPNHERELAACTTQSSGLAKVATGTAALARTDAADKADLEKSAAALAKGSAAWTEYCGELGGLVTFLKDHGNDAYKSIERELDTKITKVSRLRRDAKRLAEELAPLTRKLIPRIATIKVAAPEPTKKLPVKFPSGRSLDLPMLGGEWKLSGTMSSDVAEYTDKQVTAIVTTRQLDGDCSEHRSAIPKDADKVTELELATAAWAVRYLRNEQSGAHTVELVCLPRAKGSVLAMVDVRPETATIFDAITKVALEMAAAAR